MTREQAKAAIRDKFKDLPSRVEINTILNELPSVTPQPCEDAVSRKDVVKILGRIEQRVFDGEGFDYEESRAEIDELPPVTPQLRKGHWVYTPQKRMVDETDDGCVYETDYRCSCSECGGDFGFIRVEDSFCKYCGADMRGEEE